MITYDIYNTHCHDQDEKVTRVNTTSMINLPVAMPKVISTPQPDFSKQLTYRSNPSPTLSKHSTS